MALGKVAVRPWLRSCSFLETRFFCKAPRIKSGYSHQLSSGHGGKRGVEMFEKSKIFRRGFIFSALSYLGYNTYLVISRSAMVLADVKIDEIIHQADYLYGSGETEKLYQLLSEHKNSENAQVLWRLARALRDLAQLSHTSTEKKKQLAYEALGYAKKALEKDSNCYCVHKWYAICLSDVGDYEGIKNKISSAFVIKEHFQKAIDLNPKDATSLHLMGIWCYTFADMPWYQRNIAAILFSTPPSSTYEEALQYFQKAENEFPVPGFAEGNDSHKWLASMREHSSISTSGMHIYLPLTQMEHAHVRMAWVPLLVDSMVQLQTLHKPFTNEPWPTGWGPLIHSII